MSTPSTSSRRSFLKVSALVGRRTDARLSSWASWRPRAPPTAHSSPNAWIGVMRDGSRHARLPPQRDGPGRLHFAHHAAGRGAGRRPAQRRDRAGAVDPVYLNKLMGAQITGGSTSVRDAWEPLRTAGATARTMLVKAAAATWNVPAADCRAENGNVFHGDKTLAYGALAAAAARQPVPQDVPLKSASAFR